MAPPATRHRGTPLRPASWRLPTPAVATSAVLVSTLLLLLLAPVGGQFFPGSEDNTTTTTTPRETPTNTYPAGLTDCFGLSLILLYNLENKTIGDTVNPNLYRFSNTVFLVNNGDQQLYDWSFQIKYAAAEYVYAVDNAETTPLLPSKEGSGGSYSNGVIGDTITFYPPPPPGDVVATSRQDPTNYLTVTSIYGVRSIQNYNANAAARLPVAVLFRSPMYNCSVPPVPSKDTGRLEYCCAQIPLSQQPPGPPSSGIQPQGVCKGVLANYTIWQFQSVPSASNPDLKSFKATLTLENRGIYDVSAWAGWFQFKNKEIVKSVDPNGVVNVAGALPSSNFQFQGDQYNPGIPTSNNSVADISAYIKRVDVQGTMTTRLTEGTDLLPTYIQLFFASNGSQAQACQARAALSDSDPISRQPYPTMRFCCPVAAYNSTIKAPPPSGAPESAPAQAPTTIGIGPCQGVLLDYIVQGIQAIPPFNLKPYRFDATLRIINIGTRTLKGWGVHINYTHNEILAEVTNAKIDGVPGQSAATVDIIPTSLQDSIPNAIDVAGEFLKYQTVIDITGTVFNIKQKRDALPATLYLTQPADYKCRTGFEIFPPGTDARMQICCDETAFPPPPAIPPPTLNPELPEGSIDIQMDVQVSNDDDYWMLVTVKNNQFFRRVIEPGWALSWQWTAGEFVWETKGAYAEDKGDCLDVPATPLYMTQLQKAHSCDLTPTFRDYPEPFYYNQSYPDDNSLGVSISCCKNGSLAIPGVPYGGDPVFKAGPLYNITNATFAQFRLRVGKIPPYNTFDSLVPPTNFSIGLPGYTCGKLRLATPTEFPQGLDRVTPAVQTWKVQCVRTPGYKTSCCVSFSAFWNKTGFTNEQRKGFPLLAPCKTCACGCNDTSPVLSAPATCNSSAREPLGPVNTVVLAARNGFRNWFRRTEALADPIIVPPCGDGCGYNVHWHIQADEPTFWEVKLTIINRNLNPLKQWYMGVRLPAFDNVSGIFSFNSYNVTADSMLMWPVPNYNDWLLGTEGDEKPGNIKTRINFGKAPWFNQSLGDGWPISVSFNGDTCAMPDFKPMMAGAPRLRALLPAPLLAASLALLALVLAFV